MGVRIEVQSLWTEGEPSTQIYEFDQARIVIGRARSADVQLPHAAVSGTHASIRTEGSSYVLVDEDSTNGTRVNEAPVVPGRQKALQGGDQIDLGGYQLRVQLGVPVAEPTSVKGTASKAEAMLREQHRGESEGQIQARTLDIQAGLDQSVELLPIASETKSEPPPTHPPRPSTPSSVPPRSRIATSELMVYSLAGLLLAASLVIWFLLSRP
ncbi:MAG: FHA domain-containing protein [Myxococcota bacterium]